jgi:[ribosomal protein S5]-alanine N-acetyltransferase
VIGTAVVQHVRPAERSAEVGYRVARPHRGQGLATEIARALVAFVFEELDFERAWGCAFAENVASQRVLQHAGLRAEGPREGDDEDGLIVFGLSRAELPRA